MNVSQNQYSVCWELLSFCPTILLQYKGVGDNNLAHKLLHPKYRKLHNPTHKWPDSRSTIKYSILSDRT